MGAQIGCPSINTEDVIRSYYSYFNRIVTPTTYNAERTGLLNFDLVQTSSLSLIPIYSLYAKYTIIVDIVISVRTNNVAYTTSVQPFLDGTGIGSVFTTTSITSVANVWGTVTMNAGSLLDVRLATNNASGVASVDYTELRLSHTVNTGRISFPFLEYAMRIPT